MEVNTHLTNDQILIPIPVLIIIFVKLLRMGKRIKTSQTICMYKKYKKLYYLGGVMVSTEVRHLSLLLPVAEDP